jgi:AraC-like DNA-binding protein
MTDKSINRAIMGDLDLLEHQLNLPVCLHDRTGLLTLEPSYRMHTHPKCLKYKVRNENRCVSFDMIEVHDKYAARGHVYEITCPAGYREWIRPLKVNLISGGILFVGPLENQLLPPEKERFMGLTDWCASRLESRLEEALKENDLFHDRSSPFFKRQALTQYIEQNLTNEISLRGGADVLSLSPSRLSHLMKGLFDCTFPELVNKTRLTRAKNYLVETDLSISEIAGLVGYDDPDYFSRLFSDFFGMSARTCRKAESLRQSD